MQEQSGHKRNINVRKVKKKKRSNDDILRCKTLLSKKDFFGERGDIHPIYRIHIQQHRHIDPWSKNEYQW